MTRVDLNCDLGESFGAWRSGRDDEVMAHVTSANVACGGHAGDPASMRRTVGLARAHGVAVGAHPGLPDLAGFGRRAMAVTADEVYELVLAQAGALGAFARAAGLPLQHVKAHGALYNQAAHDAALAGALAAATGDLGKDVILVGLPGSAMEAAAARAGVPFAAEIFADRTYLADGSLTPRSRSDAFVEDAGEAARRVVVMLAEGRVRAVTGEWVPQRADTVCVHGDNPAAVAFAATLRRALQEAGVEVRALGGTR